MHTVTPELIAAHQAQARALIADFRRHSNALVAALDHAGILAAYDAHQEWDTEVTALGERWQVWLHEPHAMLTSPTGVVVEAHIYVPDDLDPSFLLTFARTSGVHQEIVDLCVAGYHDMCELLDTFEPDWGDLH